MKPRFLHALKERKGFRTVVSFDIIDYLCRAKALPPSHVPLHIPWKVGHFIPLFGRHKIHERPYVEHKS
jgi:hypothetical protein